MNMEKKSYGVSMNIVTDLSQGELMEDRLFVEGTEEDMYKRLLERQREALKRGWVIKSVNIMK